MNTDLTSPVRFRPGRAVGLIVTLVLWTTVTAAVGPLLDDPAHVDRLTIDNPHPWPVSVDATGATRDGWVSVGGVARDSAQTFHLVLDQGDSWIFRFAYGGQHAEMRTSRTRLDHDNWHVTVPDRFATRLRAAAVPETPP